MRASIAYTQFDPTNLILRHRRKASVRVLESVTGFLSQRLKLIVNGIPAKRRIECPEGRPEREEQSEAEAKPHVWWGGGS